MPLDFNFICVGSDTSASINVSRSNMKVAPEGMVFTVDLAGFDAQAPANPDDYNPQHHDIFYFWNFGDPGSTFTTPSNVMTHQSDANTMTGPVAAHTYATPGIYTVSVLIMEPSSGKTATATLELSGAEAVRDPDMIFLGPNTYWMDVNGNNSGAPAGALTYSNIQSALDHAWQNNKPARLLFRDGQIWDVPTIIDVRGERAYVNIMMQGEGSGNPAVIRQPPGAALFRARNWGENTLDILLHDLIFEGPWDDLTDLNPENPKTGFSFTSNASDGSSSHPVNYFWSHKCTFRGLYSSVTMTATGNSSSAFGMSDCDIPSWLNIGVFLNTECPTAMIGNRMARHPAALGGGNKTEHTVHGPIRSQYTGPLVIAKNDMFNNTGWFVNATGYRTQQPCIRIFQSGLDGGLANISQNSFEGGYQVIATSRQDPALGLGKQSCIIDGNILVGSHMTRFGISAEFGGMTVRNNLFIRPDVPSINANFDAQCFVHAHLPSGGNIGAATASQLNYNANAPVKVYSNSYVLLQDPTNFFGAEQVADTVSTDGFTAVQESNNLVHAPNATVPLISDGPLSTTSIFTPRTNGYRAAYELVTHTLGSNVSNGASFSVPYAAGRVAADYGPTTPIDSHQIIVSAGSFMSGDNDVSFDFGASEITVTNTSGQTWNAGEIKIVYYALNNPPPLLDQYATPTNSVATYAPMDGALALGDGLDDPVSIADLYGEIRPFYPSRGAFELEE